LHAIRLVSTSLIVKILLSTVIKNNYARIRAESKLSTKMNFFPTQTANFVEHGGVLSGRLVYYKRKVRGCICNNRH